MVLFFQPVVRPGEHIFIAKHLYGCYKGEQQLQRVENKCYDTSVAVINSDNYFVAEHKKVKTPPTNTPTNCFRQIIQK